MRVLFVHQNFPAQYKHSAGTLALDPRNEIVALTYNQRPAPKGVRIVRYAIAQGNRPGTHPLAADLESKVIRGEAAARAARQLKQDGFSPDIICGHPGWGETLFLPDIWPEARILNYMEFYYRTGGSDFNFDAEFTTQSPEAPWRVRSRNAANLLSLEAADWNVSPTHWQWQQLPALFRARTSIIHDGIDTELARPSSKAMVRLGRDRIACRPGDEIITFVNRNLEPYRGYHIFMRALPEILRHRPRARAVIVGGDKVSYGRRLPKEKSYKDIYRDEVRLKLDFSRVHFVGNVPYSIYLQLLQVSAAHIYLTYPFVLSWSMLEAMSAGCVVVGSDTQPVREVIENGRNGLLVNFFSPQQLADAVMKVLENPRKFRDIRRAARQTAVSNYDLSKVCLPQHLCLIRTVAEGRDPAIEFK